MSNTVNNGIPFVPENAIDPAAGLNLSLLTVDALMQLAVVSVGLNAPPASPANGSRYIIGTAPTGAWATRANQVGQWLDGGWRFYQARYALNQDDGSLWGRAAATWAIATGGGGGGSGEWSAETVDQTEAEAGTSTTRRAWTAQRVRQAIEAWWLGISTALGRSLVMAADAEAGRTALQLGTAAVKNTGTTGDAIPQLDTLNTWGARQRIAGASARLEIQSTAPSIWLDETDAAVGMNFVLDTGVFQLQRRSQGFGSFERTIFSLNMGAPSGSLAVGASGMVSVGSGALQLASFTVATLPSAAANTRGQVFCSNLAGQAALVFSDGTNWRRVSNNTIAN